MTSFTIDANDHIAIATGALKPQGADHFTYAAARPRDMKPMLPGRSEKHFP